ncbi:Cytochrome c, class I [Vibrio chagasii]|uniref:c-type cytochrome n=1 Tax=Vibrio TaxID=662 RepID=UPI000E329937|nr:MULTISPECIES: c-type cytochrome [Vibrio]MCG9563016.1 c-type cytochrome [Vibrio chagasii]CAH6783538.1 Cytochrome c, class I [Vibrio chagasii]CAH6804904.1 Cytochrome c, class I [Vibrio chagasii]CAH6876114.1 Cytochrome c, class I [Vibrio chagasii]CAH6907784.1 Cytochrome c, class I [Vibrio chagasii]
MNLTKFTLLLVTSTVAMMSLSACTDENTETVGKVSPKLTIQSDKTEPYIPSLMVGEKLVNNLCSQCHGDKIIPFVQSYPNIKGQKSSYILKQLRDFKSDSRQDLYMQSVVKSLSDKDFQDVAAFYSTLKPLDLYERSQEYYHQ